MVLFGFLFATDELLKMCCKMTRESPPERRKFAQNHFLFPRLTTTLATLLAKISTFILQLTGDTSFAISTVAVLLNECGEIAGRNLSSFANERGEGNPKNSLLSDLAERLCPNDCTFNGKCVNGSCICNKGFTANDCAISTKQIPTLSM